MKKPKPAAQLIKGITPEHPDDAVPCFTPIPTKPRPLSMIQADIAEWERHQRQRNAEREHLKQAEAKALQAPSLHL